MLLPQLLQKDELNPDAWPFDPVKLSMQPLICIRERRTYILALCWAQDLLASPVFWEAPFNSSSSG